MNPCPSGSFADSQTRRCVYICSGVQYGFYNASNLDRLCLFMCPEGWYGFWPTKQCMDICPNGTYA